MQLERILYVSSLVDEYGFAMPQLMASLSRINLLDEISSFTLFSNGKVMQMLEGPSGQLRTAFAHLRAEPVHFDLILMNQEPITLRSVQGTQLGLKRFANEIVKKLPTSVELFVPSVSEISKRVCDREASSMFIAFEVRS